MTELKSILHPLRWESQPVMKNGERKLTLQIQNLRCGVIVCVQLTSPAALESFPIDSFNQLYWQVVYGIRFWSLIYKSLLRKTQNKLTTPSCRDV